MNKGTGSSAQLCQNFGISGGGVEPHPPRYATVLFDVNMQCVNKDFLAGSISASFSLHFSGQTYLFLLYFYASIALVGQGILLIEVSRSHSDKPHSVEFLWRHDEPDPETSTRQHNRQAYCFLTLNHSASVQ
jgi:hypothetical protein